MSKPKVYAALATIPQRKRTLKKVVSSLMPQVDKVFIYFNGHDRVPSWVKEDDKIEYAMSRDHGDLGDVGKFFWCQDYDGVFFTCDDDIVYPDDYVKSTVSFLERFKFNVVGTLHGATINRGATQYHAGKKLYSLKSTQPVSKQVHIGGTGCMAFHTDTIRPELEWFKLSNMADIWIGERCQQLRIPIIMKAHEGFRFKLLENKVSIFDSTHSNDGTDRDRAQVSNEIVKRTQWAFPPVLAR